MPELPDVAIYAEALRTRLVGQRLEQVQLLSPFVLRSVDPPLASVVGATIRDVFRLGKRLVFAFDSPSDILASDSAIDDEEIFLVLHLMIAGRLRWREPQQKPGVGA